MEAPSFMPGEVPKELLMDLPIKIKLKYLNAIFKILHDEDC